MGLEHLKQQSAPVLPSHLGYEISDYFTPFSVAIRTFVGLLV